MSAQREAERLKTVDLMLSCSQLVTRAIAELEEADETVGHIRALAQKARIDLSGDWLLNMEADLYSLRAGVGLAKSTLAEADKALTRASSGLFERDLAVQIKEDEIATVCIDEVDNAIATAQARIEEARKLAVAASLKYNAFRFPVIFVRA